MTEEKKGYTPRQEDMPGALMFAMIALIQELKSEGALNGDALADRLKNLVDPKNYTDAIRMFEVIARHGPDDI